MSHEIQEHRVPGPGGLPVAAVVEWIDDYRTMVLPDDGETDATCNNCLNFAILLTRTAEHLGVTLAAGEVPMFGPHPTEADTWVFWTLAERDDDDGAAKLSPANVPDLAGETNRLDAAVTIALKYTEGAV